MTTLGRKLSIILLIASLGLTFTFAPSQTLASNTTKTMPFGSPGAIYNFTLTTNATIVNDNITKAGEARFNFTFTGSQGTTAWANITVCKEVGYFPPGQAKPQNIRITMNGQNVNSSAPFNLQAQQITPSQNVSCIWVYWTIPHFSTWATTADVSLAVPLQAPVFPEILPVLALISLAAIGARALTSRHRKSY